MTYVDCVNATSVWRRDANHTNCGDAEQIEGGRTDDGSRSKLTSFKSVANNLNTGQENLWSARAERHQCQVGDRVVPDLSSAETQIDSTTLLMPNSTTRTPDTDMLYNTTNGQAQNNSTACCTTNLPHRNARAQHLDMSICWYVANICQLVVNLLYTKL